VLADELQESRDEFHCKTGVSDGVAPYAMAGLLQKAQALPAQ
jgi:hypothetical protein